MSTQEVICRVRALYPYDSSDTSSLSFKADAIIDVFSQLDSGWWDGWCNGRRGWFPSNYVEVIEERGIEYQFDEREVQMRRQQQQSRTNGYRQRVLDDDMKKQLRLSLHASEMAAQSYQREVNTSNKQNQSDWTVQTTEDGSEQYYYNTKTQEMRYSMPPDFFTNDKTASVSSNPSNISLNDTFSYNNANVSQSNELDQFERPPVRPVRAANRSLTENYYIETQNDHRKAQNNMDHAYISPRSAAAVVPSHLINKQSNPEFEDDEKLPPNWIRKVTLKGKPYYHNVKTEETTWSLDNLDPNTGFLLSSPTSPYPTSSVSRNNSYQDLFSTVEEPQVENVLYDEAPESITWQSLSSYIAQAIAKLKETIRQRKTAYYSDIAAIIVHRIRLLLYVSNCLEKETSPHLKASKQLRVQHRALLAAVAKLVLSAKVATSPWPSPESFSKLQADAEETLITVRNYISFAHELQIELKDDKPILKFDKDEWRQNSLTLKSTATGLILGSPETVTSMLVLAEGIRTAIKSFRDSVKSALDLSDITKTLENLKANAPLLVAQFRNLSNTTSYFLNVIEEICQLQYNDPRAQLLIKAKKPIYNAMGALFIVVQIITGENVTQDQLETSTKRLDECSQSVESGTQEVIQAVQAEVDESILESIRRETSTPTQKAIIGGVSRHIHSESINDRPSALPTVYGVTSTFSGESTGDELNASLVNAIRNLEAAYHPGDEDISTINLQQRDFKHFEPTIGTPNSGTGSINNSSSTGPSSVNLSSPTAENPWFLAPDADPNEILFTPEGSVKGGTLNALVQHLTQHDQLDSKFNSTFLLTYRSFCTTQELFDELFNRYQLPVPEGLIPEEIELWKEKKLKLVRLRVFNVFKSWLETYFNEEEDRPMLPILTEFTDTIINESMKFGTEQLSKLIKKRMTADDQIRKMKLNVRSDMPVPILPKNMKRIKLLELDPHELARQMTLTDFRLYSRIKPVECLDKNWGKTETDEHGRHIAANIKASIEHSNQVTAWVTDSILSKDEVRKRAYVLKHWILVAERCRLLNNYNTCMAILSAFDNGSIGRLKRTWELISARIMQILQNIRRLMGANKNFSEYREIIHKVSPPCIPFLGIYLQDLTFIEDGNSNFLKKTNHLINFSKRMKTAEVIRDLQQYQTTHYMLASVPDIQEFIKTHLHSSREEEELYNLSLKLEPRERGEDTIARRLKESGL